MGKSTTLRALARALTAGGDYAAMHFTCEAASAAGDDDTAAQLAILDLIRRRALSELPPELRPPEAWGVGPDAAGPPCQSHAASEVGYPDIPVAAWTRSRA